MVTERMSARRRLHTLEESLTVRLRRVGERSWSILQIALAASLSFWVAQELLGHKVPFFAPISVIIVLGLSAQGRITRSMDMALGCVVGVAVGDLMFLLLGPGAWQISLMVGISLIVGSFLSSSQLVNNQIAIGSILIVTIMPPGSETTGLDRTLDAVVGVTVGLLVVALLPSSPLREARREVGGVLAMISSVLDDVSEALREGDPHLAEEALEAARGSQSKINAMVAAANSGMEATRVSPLLWSRQRNVRHLERALMPIDNAIRNVRVLARRAVVITQDKDQQTVSPQLLGHLEELAAIALDLSDVFDGTEQLSDAIAIPELVRRLRSVGAQLGMESLGFPGEQSTKPVLSTYAILAQARSVTADLLEVCGMSRQSAVAALAPTSTTPAFPPEVPPGVSPA